MLMLAEAAIGQFTLGDAAILIGVGIAYAELRHQIKTLRRDTMEALNDTRVELGLKKYRATGT